MAKNPCRELHFCMNCEGNRNHTTLCEKRVSEHTDVYNYWAKFAIIQCNGCDEISFLKETCFSEDIDDDGRPKLVRTLYPERHKLSRRAKEYCKVPFKLRNLYIEIIEAYNSESPLLCAAGLRSLVEGICADLKIKKGPTEVLKKGGIKVIEQTQKLEGKINGLVETGYLSKKHASILHRHRFLGNDALHDLDKPTFDCLRAAIDIIEHTLENLYELEDKAGQIIRKKK